MKKRFILFFVIGLMALGVVAQDREHMLRLGDMMKPKGNTFAFALDQNLRTTDSPTFAGLMVNGRTISIPVTLTIAASNSKAVLADYVCDGTADEVQINAAIQALDGLGGRIVLMEGTFYINAPITYSLLGTPDSNITLEGQGDATILKVPDSHATSMSIIDAGLEHGGNIVTLSSWTATTGWAYTSKWTHTAGNTTALVDDKSVAIVVGTRYKMIVGYTYTGANSITFSCGGFTGTVISSNAFTSVEYDFIATSTAAFSVAVGTGFTGTINSVSILPVLDSLVFKNFRIDNNSMNVTGTYYNGIVLWSTTNCKIENVTLINGKPNGASAVDGYGIVTIHCYDMSISGCHINQWETNGLEMGSGDRAGISGNFFNQSRIEIYPNVKRVIFSGLNIFNNTPLEIGTDDSGIDIDGLNFAGNLFYKCGINVDNADNIVFSGNYFGGEGCKIIFSSDVNNITITGNVMMTDWGIQIGGNGGLISNNKLTAIANWVPLISSSVGSAPSGWEIKNNTFSIASGMGADSGVSLLSGTGIIISDNKFNDGFGWDVLIDAGVTSCSTYDNTFGATDYGQYTNNDALSVNYSYGQTNRRLYKITKTFTQFGALGAASLTADMVIAVFPAKTKIVSMYCDTTTKYIGGGTTAATIVIGKSAGGGEYIASHDVFAAAIVKGLADADMGTELTRAAAIQGGALVDWTTAITVTARLTTTTAHTDDLTQGSTTFYIETESY